MNRRRQAVFAALITLLPAPALAQTGGFIATQYSAPYVALGSGTMANFASLDDDVIQVPLGFSFTYFGVSYTHVNISTNGALVFASACQTILDCPISFNNFCVSGRCLIDPGVSAPSAGMPAPADPNQVVAPWWDDLHLQGGAVTYATTGTAPNRTFVVQYDTVRHYPQTTLATANFQVRLEESTGAISYHYGPYTSNINGDSEWSGTMGIENETGALGLPGLPCANDAANGYCDYLTLQSLTDSVILFVQPTGPELVVSGTTPTGGAPGAQITVSVTAQNVGPAATGVGFTADVYFSDDDVIEGGDTHLGTVTFPQLAGGAMTTQTLQFNVPMVPPGYYSVGAIVDPADVVAETVEVNNVGRFTDRFLVGADLEIEVMAPAQTGPGQLLSVDVAILNNGAELPAVPYSVYMSTDTALDGADILLGTSTVAVPATPRSMYTIDVTVPLTVPGGPQYLIAVVDPTNAIPEADETNNVTASPTTIDVRLADIVAVDVAHSDMFAFRSEVFRTSVVLENTGGAVAGGFHYALYFSENQLISAISDHEIASFGPISLAPGERRTFNHDVVVPASIPVGLYYLGVITNTLSSVDEGNPNNNIARTMAPVEVRDPAPDFTVAAVRAPTMGAAGESMPLSRTILNRGNAGGTFGYEVYLSVDEIIDTTQDTLVGTFTASIAGGQSNASVDVVRVPSDLAAGAYYVGYLADPAQAVTELLEDNNTGVSEGTVAILGSPLTILTASLPLATLGVPYDVVLAARGGQGPLVWTLLSGALPAGLTLATDGALSGTPEEEGLFAIRVEVTDGTNTRTRELDLLVAPTNADLEILTRALPPAFVDRPYEYPLTAYGGVPPYRWLEVSPNDLPAGLTLFPDGVLRGTPTEVADANLTFRVRDATDAFTDRSIQLLVVTPGDTVRFSSELLPDGRLGQVYDEKLRVEMGSGVSPFFYDLVSGSLPDGLDHNLDVISGTPMLIGEYSFTMRVTDSRGDFDVNRFTVRINEQNGVSFSTVALPVAYVGEDYLDDDGEAVRIKAVGVDVEGRPTLSIISGTLPLGLEMAETGEITGTPTSEGIFPFVVRAADPLGQTALRAYGISVTSQVEPTAPSDGGCGCRSTGRSRGVLFGALLPLLLLLRRRRFWLTALVVMWPNVSSAQSYFIETRNEPYVNRTNTNLAAFPPFFDEEETSIPLPFPFDYFGQQYTQVRVTTNAYVTFGQDPVEFRNTDLPNSGTPNNLIAMFWDDTTSTGVEWVVEGTAPNRVMIIQFSGMTLFGNATAGRPQAQLWLYEGLAGIFEMRYGPVINMSDPIAWRTSIGFEGPLGGEGYDFLNCSPLCNGTVLGAQDGVVFRARQDGGTELVATSVVTPPEVFEGVPTPIEVTIESLHGNPLGPFVYELHLLAPGQTTPGNLLYRSAPVVASPYDFLIDTATVTVPLNTPAGRYRMLLVVDADDQVLEPEEANNEVVSVDEFEIAARRPDFAVANVSSVQTEATPGSALDVEMRIDNRGNLSGDTGWRLMLSENPVITVDDIELDRGSVTIPLLRTATVTRTVTLPNDVPGGSYFLGVIADADNQVVEIDEVNNAGPADDEITIRTSALEVTTMRVPLAYVGVPYSAYVFATGGDGNYMWSVESGMLPDGLELVAATGEIRGIATSVMRQMITVRVDSGGLSATRDLELRTESVGAGLALVTRELLPGVVGASYPPAPRNATPDMQQRLVAVGGSGSYNFALRSTPPPGLELDVSGYLHGVPRQDGVYELAVEVDDGVDTIEERLLLTVGQPGRLTLVAARLPSGRLGEEYSYQLQVIGKTPTATVTFDTGGPLPDGVLLSPEGRLVGIPQQVGTRSFLVRAIESGRGATEDTAGYQLTIDNDGGFSITPSTLDVGRLDEPYVAQLSTRMGTGPYVWRVLGPPLHKGILWSVNEETDIFTIEGTPEVIGLATVLITVTDTNGRYVQQPYSLLVEPPPTMVVPQDDGCGCTASNERSPSGLALLSLLIGLGIRRRYRR